MHISVAPSIHFSWTCQKKACSLDTSWSGKLHYSVALENLSVWAHKYLPLASLKPVAFPRTTTQDWKMKGGKQQGRHNNGPLWKPSGNSETTQRVSCRSAAFPQPHRELAPAGLDCRTCRDAYWLTHWPRGVELGGRGTNRSDNSQRRGMGRGDGCCTADGWWRVSELTRLCRRTLCILRGGDLFTYYSVHWQKCAFVVSSCKTLSLHLSANWPLTEPCSQMVIAQS